MRDRSSYSSYYAMTDGERNMHDSMRKPKKGGARLLKFILITFVLVIVVLEGVYVLGDRLLTGSGETAYAVICSEYEKAASLNPLGKAQERRSPFEEHEVTETSVTDISASDISASDMSVTGSDMPVMAENAPASVTDLALPATAAAEDWRQASESDIIKPRKLETLDSLRLRMSAGANRLWAMISGVEAYVFTEAGQKVTAYDFIKKDGVTAYFINEPDEELFSTVGCHELSIGGDKHFNALLIVTDTVAPVIAVSDCEIWATDELDLRKAIVSMEDESPVCLTCDGGLPDTSTAGEKLLYIKATDVCGNESGVETVKLTIRADEEPPEIVGLADKSMVVGETVLYKQGIELHDNRDSADQITLKVDSSSVDPKTAGTYEVTYTATDRAGNETVQKIKVKFITESEKKKDETLNGYVTKIAKSIFKDSMTPAQKLKAIYNWCRDHIHYSGHSTKDDWKNGAIRGFKNRSGDCYTFFACSKALMEYCGMKNIDVVKVKVNKSESSHYWSLVDLGTGYYHFDSTPRVGGFNGFMRTDAQLQSYSRNHKNSHRFDTSKYPATPKTKFS